MRLIDLIEVVILAFMMTLGIPAFFWEALNNATVRDALATVILVGLALLCLVACARHIGRVLGYESSASLDSRDD